MRANNNKCVGVSAEDYEQACEDCAGYCPHCESFTRDSTEPDAEGYDCENCGGNDVCGAEQALLIGWIDITS
jgi:hypothetical protein